MGMGASAPVYLIPPRRRDSAFACEIETLHLCSCFFLGGIVTARSYRLPLALVVIAIGLGAPRAQAATYYYSPGLYLVGGGAAVWPSPSGSLDGGIVGVGVRFNRF